MALINPQSEIRIPQCAHGCGLTLACCAGASVAAAPFVAAPLFEVLLDVLLVAAPPVVVVALLFVVAPDLLPSVVVFDAPLVLSPPVEKPLGPLMPSPFGSTPRGDVPLRPSMPRIAGRSSRLTGFTNCAVMMNISSVSCF